MIDVWLDDERPAPRGWVRADNVEWVKTELLFGEVRNLSLDHDLGEGMQTGYDLVKWMAENNCWPSEKPVVHSMNPVGRANMQATIDRYYVPQHRSE